MNNKSAGTKIIEGTLKYVWNRVKMIGIMIILIVLVKNLNWDRIFWFILILQIVLGLYALYKMSDRVLEAQKAEYAKQKRTYNQRFYRQTWNSGYRQQRQRQTVSTDDSPEKISTSAQLLGINIIQDSEDIIKKKYRNLAMKWHPDRFATDTEENQKIAHRNFQKLNAAYEIVKKFKNIK